MCFLQDPDLRLPFPIRLSSMVATPDGKGVILVAGYGKEGSTDTLIELRQNKWTIGQSCNKDCSSREGIMLHFIFQKNSHIVSE